MYAEVAVGGKTRLLLHYDVPPALAGRLAPGHLVRVPLRDEERFGVVVALAPSAPVAATRPLLELIDPLPAVTPPYLALAHWLADFYLAPLADCMWLMVPPPRVGPRRVHSVQRVATAEQIEAARPILGRSVKQADVLDWLAACDDPLPTVAQVRAAVGCNPGHLRALAQQGWIELEQESGLDTVLLLLSPDEARTRAAELRGSTVYHSILDFLNDQGDVVPVEAVKAATRCELRHLQRLETLGLIVLSETQVMRDPLSDVEFVPTDPPPLTPDQAAVWGQIEPGLQVAGGQVASGQVASGRVAGDERQKTAPPTADRPPLAFLLHGVTGSGKTEIYLRAVAATLAQGRRAIVLVPEISLTPQTTRRFLARFPGRVGLFHSQLSPGERYDTWQRARDGLIDIVVGPRSALFTPLPDLGLIVIDEEHDASFKAQERAPAYHAREVALELARRVGATLILGSATPSLESFQRAQTGEFRLLRLPQRIRGHVRRLEQQQKRYQEIGIRLSGMRYRDEGEQVRYIPLPPVQVVDLRQELRAGNRHIFSRALQRALRETLARGEQAILFLNRRGHATFVLCRDCGHVLRCPHCDVPLTQHMVREARGERREARGEGRGARGERRGMEAGARAAQLVCHHCNYRVPVPSHCPACGSARIRHFGLGTQQVERAMRELFPAARTLRWDRDTATRPGAHRMIMDRFADGQADVLVGTQMIAKGLDLPLVTLVGVISADTALNLPDFRAAERTFQLLTQVAGRAGRGLLGGRVIVQTYNPDHYAVRAAAHHDYTAFAQRELAFRREHDYPPYRRLVRLEYRHRKPERARLAAERLAETLRATLVARGLPPEDLIGPAPAFFAKRRDLYRWQIVLRAEDPAELLRQVEIPGGWRVDIDPVSVL
jgi:primosomal protein N' (replication factor Y)